MIYLTGCKRNGMQIESERQQVILRCGIYHVSYSIKGSLNFLDRQLFTDKFDFYKNDVLMFTTEKQPFILHKMPDTDESEENVFIQLPMV